MEADETGPNPSGAPNGDEPETLESGPFGVESLRWTRSAGDTAAVRTSINRSFASFTPIYLSVYNDIFEVKPSRLYLELEVLSLDDASDEARRAYVALREQVIEDVKEAARQELDDAMDEH